MHRRTAIGFLKPPALGSSFTFLKDRSRHLPFMEIQMSSWPENFDSHPDQYENKLIEADISYWINIYKTCGQVVQVLGTCGEIKVERLALAKEFCLEHPKKMSHKSKAKLKIGKKKNFREKSLVFSLIDTRTNSVNIAFSCCSLTEEVFRISVHISNVAYLLENDAVLTNYISKRSATIWLQDVIYQMMPEDIHKQCSLIPGEDKPVVSIIFEITKNGEVLSTKFEESFVNPCVTLDVQQIEQIACQTFSKDLKILNGYSRKDLFKTIENMNTVANALKQQKQSKTITYCYYLAFEIDVISKEPLNMKVAYVNWPNDIFKQIIFLVNSAVGELIFNKFPNLAILR